MSGTAVRKRSTGALTVAGVLKNKAIMQKALFGLLAVAVLSSGPAAANDYPTRTITIVVPAAAGGGLDRVVRLIAEKLRAKWGQPVVVENRGGAGGVIGTEFVARAAPDGYTYLFAGTGQLVIDRATKVNYDPEAFAPVSLVTTAPNVLVVNSSVPATSVQELIALAKADPDRLNYASQGIGTTQHLSVEYLKSLAGINIVHVPFSGGAPALVALLGGQVEVMFTEISGVLQNIRTGKLRALAVGSEMRNALLPDVPAMSEVLPDFVSMTWQGMVAPPGTPPAITTMMSEAIAETVKQPDVAKQLIESSLDSIGSTPAEMASFMQVERARWRKVVRAAAQK
jgi:tripartite-type tricarboxylate transporter receptor subunit TctC